MTIVDSIKRRAILSAKIEMARKDMGFIISAPWEIAGTNQRGVLDIDVRQLGFLSVADLCGTPGWEAIIRRFIIQKVHGR